MPFINRTCQYETCSDNRDLISVLRRVPRLVNKRGRVKLPQLEKETAENLVEDEAGEDWNGNQKKEQTSVGVENLIERMKELKVFPKLEYRRRHLKQVLKHGCFCCRSIASCNQHLFTIV